ncbi:MAG TPA: flagellar export protein FliJ [Candidatus Ozemobacteraceae bacterium]|nr:flagellar export protein FliJ [Candidatus Ozemobacteraceae bacterium]
MPFSYRFHHLLRLAEHEEEEVRRRLAMKDGQIAAAEAEIRKIQLERQHGLEAKAVDLIAGAMERVRLYPAYFLRLQNREDFQNEELERLRKQREKIAQELAEKRQTRKTYEKIRERDEAVFKKQEQRRDQKNMDEFASRLTRPFAEENHA